MKMDLGAIGKPLAGLCTVFLFSVIGNLSLLVVIFSGSGKKVRATDRFISSMALSELLMALVCCPRLALELISLFNDFPIENSQSTSENYSVRFFCKLCTFLFHWSFTCSILALLAIGIERFLVVCFPRIAASIVTTSNVKRSIAALWVIAIAVASPMLKLVHAEQWGNCSLGMDGKDTLITSIICFVYVIPAFMLLISYSIILSYLAWSALSTHTLEFKRLRRIKQHSRDHAHVICMLSLLLAAFLITWGSFLVYQLDQAKRSLNPFMMYSDDYTQLSIASFLRPAMNPLLLPVLSPWYRVRYAKALGCTKLLKRKLSQGNSVMQKK